MDGCKEGWRGEKGGERMGGRERGRKGKKYTDNLEGAHSGVLELACTVL